MAVRCMTCYNQFSLGSVPQSQLSFVFCLIPFVISVLLLAGSSPLPFPPATDSCLYHEQEEQYLHLIHLADLLCSRYTHDTPVQQSSLSSTWGMWGKQPVAPHRRIFWHYFSPHTFPQSKAYSNLFHMPLLDPEETCWKQKRLLLQGNKCNGSIHGNL